MTVFYKKGKLMFKHSIRLYKHYKTIHLLFTVGMN